MRLPHVYSIATVAALLLCIPGDLRARSGAVRFNLDIRPILSANCFSCHGPDEASREADLRLDTRDGAFADLGDYRILVAGKPDASELYRRIASDDPDEQMPPPDSEHQLSADEIALVKEWIEQGAPWDRHWSFVTPTRPAVPEVEDLRSAHTAIDRFVLARLQEEGLGPSAETDRRTLVRRVTFDLTGLPPAPEDVQAFVADTSIDAYEKVVDRLLASKHYGEHMARFWLDAARYGDTHGLHLDNYREMWPYRDWVIGAFNANLPYDRFLVEQIAGDLLPEATLEQQVASGFNRCHVSTNEGGSIDEEVYVRNVVDRVSTMGTVCLGLTVGCAVCHDHKFDPVTQKEFYQLFAFFNSLDGQSMDGNVKDPAPTVSVPSPEQSAVLAKLDSKRAILDSQRKDRRQAIEPEFENWLLQLDKRAEAQKPNETFQIDDRLVIHCALDEGEGTVVSNAVDPEKSGQVVGNVFWVPGKLGSAIEFKLASLVDMGQVGDFKEDKPFSYGAWIKTTPGAQGTVIAKMDVKDKNEGYDLTVWDQRLVVMISARYPGYAIKVASKEQLCTPDTWHHVFVTYDGSRRASGVGVYVDGMSAALKVESDSLKSEGGIGNNKPLQFGRRDQENDFVGGSIDEVRLYDRQLSPSDVEAIFLIDQLAPALQNLRREWTTEQREMLRQLYLLRDDPIYGELTAKIVDLQQQYRGEVSQVSKTLVFRERDQPRNAFVLIRGQYDQRGEKVDRKTPDFLPTFDESLPRDRLGLARWLVSAEHPLTSRVAVNRLWQQVFGIGLVETSEDFGSQGSPPSHPHLLDWLAVDFRENGWDVKALMKQLVMSATYRQGSQTTPALTQRDPRNRLLARGPRFRLDAEMLRDQALAISGMLVKQIGGPSVKPPQPAGLWKAVGYSGSNTVTFVTDEGSDKVYRRSLYTFWKRTSPPPQMSTLDAPSRESCTMRRERTNTPLQALLLMNDPQYVETARHFGERILKEAGRLPRERIEWAFEKAALRAPSSSEIDQLLMACNHFRLAYAGDVGGAKSLIAVGESPPDDSLNPVELATWTMMANVLLNLDEVVTKE